jgi:hypothetical protein
MNFPSFGDVDSFLQLGDRCSQALSGELTIFDGCYQSIRPIGALLYFAIPYLISRDPVTISYIILALNIGMFLIASLSIQSLFCPAERGGTSGVLPLRFLLISVVVLIFTLPTIPVALSDLPAAAFFLLGISILFS